MVGSSEVIGSWKTIAIFGPRILCICLSESFSEILALEEYLTALHDGVGLGVEAHDALGRHRFARARLPDYGEGLALPQVEGHAPYRLHLASVRLEGDPAGPSTSQDVVGPFMLSSILLAHLRVEGIAQTVAQQVEAEHQQAEHRGREPQEVSMEPHVVAPASL